MLDWTKNDLIWLKYSCDINTLKKICIETIFIEKILVNFTNNYKEMASC